MSQRRVTRGEIDLCVHEAGSGPAVVLLHGFPDSGLMWHHQITALAGAGFHVLAPDLRGFGNSSRPEGTAAYALAELRGDVTHLMDAYGLERAVIVGHDWGAALAWSLAMHVPHRVERLVAVSVGHPGASVAAGLPQRQLSWYMLWFLFPGVAERTLPNDDWAFYRSWAWNGASRGDDPELDRQLTDLSRPGALSSALNWYRANIDPARFAMSSAGAKARGRVTCPTMGVWSSGDMALGEAQMRLSGDFVDGPWRYERIDGVDHWVPVHAPEQLNALLLDFLGAVQASPR